MLDSTVRQIQSQIDWMRKDLAELRTKVNTIALYLPTPQDFTPEPECGFIHDINLYLDEVKSDLRNADVSVDELYNCTQRWIDSDSYRNANNF